MKKIIKIFKIVITFTLKIIMAIFMGLQSSMGNKTILEEKKDNKTISSNK